MTYLKPKTPSTWHMSRERPQLKRHLAARNRVLLYCDLVVVHD